MNPNDEETPLTEEQKAEYRRSAQEWTNKFNRDLLGDAIRHIQVSKSWSRLFYSKDFDGGPRPVKYRATLSLTEGLKVHKAITCRLVARFSLSEIEAEILRATAAHQAAASREPT